MPHQPTAQSFSTPRYQGEYQRSSDGSPFEGREGFWPQKHPWLPIHSTRKPGFVTLGLGGAGSLPIGCMYGIVADIFVDLYGKHSFKYTIHASYGLQYFPLEVNTYKLRKNIPSWELTCPPDFRHVWRWWFSKLPQVGYGSVPWRVKSLSGWREPPGTRCCDHLGGKGGHLSLRTAPH